jgi:predicted SprT family Zn-dependent metalloprotease
MSNLLSWNFECPACGGKHLMKRREEPERRQEKAFCAYCMGELPTRFGGFNLYCTPVQAPLQREY